MIRSLDNVNFQHVRRSIVVLTDAELKVMPTTGVCILVPAPAQNQFIYPLAAHLRLKWFDDYSSIAGGAQIQIRSNVTMLGFLDEGIAAAKVSDLLAGGDHASAILGPTGFVSAGSVYGVSGLADVHIGVGAALELTISNGAAEFGGGDERNTLTITTFYSVVDVSA